MEEYFNLMLWYLSFSLLFERADSVSVSMLVVESPTHNHNTYGNITCSCTKKIVLYILVFNQKGDISAYIRVKKENPTSYFTQNHTSTTISNMKNIISVEMVEGADVEFFFFL